MTSIELRGVRIIRFCVVVNSSNVKQGEVETHFMNMYYIEHNSNIPRKIGRSQVLSRDQSSDHEWALGTKNKTKQPEDKGTCSTPF